MSRAVRIYQKKPVRILAIQLVSEPTPEYTEELHSFLKDVQWESDRNGGILIHTLEGVMGGDQGDYIIRGVAGEFYPCKPDIFAATYGEVTL